jgi:hypothetical protein
MDNVGIMNDASTQILIDGKSYELPDRVRTIIELSESVIFHCYSEILVVDSVMQTRGRCSLFCMDKNNSDIIWKMKDVIHVKKAISQKKDESWFTTEDQYHKYLHEFKEEEKFSVYIGEFRHIVDASNGEILSSTETR